MIVFDDLLFIPYRKDNVMPRLSQREQLVGHWFETGRCYATISVLLVINILLWGNFELAIVLVVCKTSCPGFKGHCGLLRLASNRVHMS